jgi:aminocarboxymuconate-semialdehyde decarboxylase
VGADRVVLGTDLPFDMGDPEPLATLDRAGVSASDRQAIAHGNAAALFRIRPT